MDGLDERSDESKDAPLRNLIAILLRDLAATITGAIGAERDACAEIADELRGREPDDLDVAEEIACRIRQRNQRRTR